jgi:hypothetical protein
MANQVKTITPEVVLDAIKARPDGFLSIDFSVLRQSKNTNKYTDVFLVLANGQKAPLALSWKLEPIRSNIKPFEERKKGTSLQFRSSSGDLGKVVDQIYKEFARLVKKGVDDKLITAKGTKAVAKSIVQREIESTGALIEDPIIRFQLAFNKKKPCFEISKVVQDENGKPRLTEIKCDEDDINLHVRSRMISTGHVTMNSVVFSAHRISIPAVVKLLVLKPATRDSPSISNILSVEEMLSMVGDSDEHENENSAADTEQQLEELRNLAVGNE